MSGADACTFQPQTCVIRQFWTDSPSHSHQVNAAGRLEQIHRHCLEGQLRLDCLPRASLEQGVLATVEKANIKYDSVGGFAHGTTVVINALTERRGVKTALITAEGFRDVLEIARGDRQTSSIFAIKNPSRLCLAIFAVKYLNA